MAASPPDREPDPAAFKSVLGCLPTGVTVVTTTDGEVLHGMTANAVTSLSLEPPLVLVCVDRSAGLHDLVLDTERFAATVLSTEQQPLASWFASPRRPHGRDQFDGVRWQPAPATGCPVLERGLAYVDCRLVAAHPGGDHTIVVGETLALGHMAGAEPLLWYEGAYRRLAEDG
jgi:flavin reductase (DIM6/NTAB) family NADH-FMN oxidoreductase RutF